MKVIALALALFAASVSAQVDANTVDPCLKACVRESAAAVGCFNENDIAGSIQCGCGEKKNDALAKGVACIQSKCPEQLAGAWPLYDKMCKEGITGNIW